MNRKQVRGVIRGAREPITRDRTLWGILTEDAKGTRQFPEVLMTDRSLMQACVALMPPAMRAKAKIVRIYVTMWKFEDTEPKKRARRSNGQG